MLSILLWATTPAPCALASARRSAPFLGSCLGGLRAEGLGLRAQSSGPTTALNTRILPENQRDPLNMNPHN